MTTAPDVKLGIRILKFWTNYKPNGAGGMQPVDMVAYCPRGEANLTTTIDTVSRLAKVRPFEPGSEDIAAYIANLRWDTIRPAYEAWKKGHEAPATGTPIGAWPGVSPEQADAMRVAGFRSVEEFAEASDGQLQRLPLPGTHRLRDTARAFLAAADKTVISSALAQKDAEMAALKAELEEMRQLMLQSLAQDESGTAAKKRARKPEPEAQDAKAAA
jgi:hypothetical protein